MAQSDVDSWNAGLKQILCARVTNCMSSTAMEAELTNMDTYWGSMSAGEKQGLAAKMASCNVTGAKTRTGLATDGSEEPYFPKAIVVSSALYDDLVTRFTA